MYSNPTWSRSPVDVAAGSLVAQVQEAVELLYADSHSDDYLAARLRGMG